MAEVTVVVLAGGRSTRYGKPKQLEPVGPSGEAILDITLADAFAAGCERAVLVCRPEHATVFQARFADDPRVRTVVQPEALGTAHALLLAMEQATGAVVVANGDDHYGAAAITAAVRAAQQQSRDHALVAFELGRTLSRTGSVNRALCSVQDGLLVDTEELTGLQVDGDAVRDDQGRSWPVDALVSMNLWVFRAELKALFVARFAQYQRGQGEFGLPDVVRAALAQGERFRVLRSSEQWAGLTHPGDRSAVLEALRLRIAPTEAAAIAQVLQAYGFQRDRYVCARLGNGLINSTYRIDHADGSVQVLQRVNTTVFPKPEQIAQNTRLAHAELRDTDQRLLLPIPTEQGDELHSDDSGHWRLFPFVADSVTHTGPATPARARAAAAAFANLHAGLAKADVRRFHELLPGFHRIDQRYAELLEAERTADPERRASGAAAFTLLQTHAQWVEVYRALVAAPDVPLRIVHNDTKLSNVLFRAGSDEVIQLIDLDTLQPGYVLFDLGDMLRSYLPSLAEDAADTSGLVLDEALFRAVQEGWCSVMLPVLSPTERKHLYSAGALLIFEQAVRFLCDHFRGDVYYRSTRPLHNLDRARNQLAVLAAYEAARPQYEAIIAELLAGGRVIG